MVDETVLNIRGIRLSLRKVGAGPTLLFLHGAQGLLGWPAALGLLSRHFTVLAPDHPGFGRSDMSDAIDDVSDLAYFYLDVLAELGLGAANVVGECLGGWIALEMAVRSTEGIASLTLAGSAGIRVSGVQPADFFLATPEEVMGLLFASDRGADWLRAWQATPKTQDLYDRNRIAAAKYCWQPRLYHPQLAKWLHRIDVPTHIVWGQADRVLPPVYASRLQQMIAGAKITVLPNCGHLQHFDQPDEFAAAIGGFIDGISP